MCRVIERTRDETAHEKALEIARSLLADGMSCNAVAKHTKLPIKDVEALASKCPV